MVSSILVNVSTTAKIDNKKPKTKVYIHPRKGSYPDLGIGDTFKVDVKIDGDSVIIRKVTGRTTTSANLVKTNSSH